MRRKKPANPEHYDYIRAVRDGGELRLEWRLIDATVVGRQVHDEDISDWSDEQVRRLVRALLAVEADDPVVVDVAYA